MVTTDHMQLKKVVKNLPTHTTPSLEQTIDY